MLHCREKTITEMYTEKHHITPKSMGGDNFSQNIVILTAREHFLCHWLLTKMCMDKSHTNKMIYAFHSMGMKNGFTTKRHINSRAYQHNKVKLSKLMSDRMKENNPMSDLKVKKKHLKNTKLRGKTRGTTGLQHTLETKQKMSESAKGRKASKATKEKLSKIVSSYWEEQRKNGTNKRQACSEEKKRKISETLKRTYAKNKEKKND